MNRDAVFLWLKMKLNNLLMAEDAEDRSPKIKYYIPNYIHYLI
jgi:hypothetical protein